MLTDHTIIERFVTEASLWDIMQEAMQAHGGIVEHGAPRQITTIGPYIQGIIRTQLRALMGRTRGRGLPALPQEAVCAPDP